MIKRISLESGVSGAALIANLREGRSKSLPFTDHFAQNEGWITIWGDEIVDNNIQIKASPKAHGAAVFLDGSFLWTDYLFEAHVWSVVGDNIGLMARYVDKSNFVTCNYLTDSVSIEQRLNNKTEILARREMPIPIEIGNFSIGAEVVGNHVSCLIEDMIAVEAPLSPTLSVGGIGLKCFDRDVATPEFVINSVSVEPLP